MRRKKNYTMYKVRFSFITLYYSLKVSVYFLIHYYIEIIKKAIPLLCGAFNKKKKAWHTFFQKKQKQHAHQTYNLLWFGVFAFNENLKRINKKKSTHRKQWFPYRLTFLLSCVCILGDSVAIPAVYPR
jgi:hypothetical protein